MSYTLPSAKFQAPQLLRKNEQPNCPVAVDWNHPASRGLEYCFIPQGGTVKELVKGYGYTLAGGAKADGKGFYLDASTETIQLDAVPNYDEQNYLVKYRSAGTTGVGDGRIVFSPSSGTMIQRYNSASVIRFFPYTGATCDFTVSVDIEDGDEHTILVVGKYTQSTSSSYSIYIDGKLEDTLSSIAYSALPTSHALYLLNDAGYDNIDGTISLLAYFSEPVKDPAGLCADPYQFLIPA